MLSLATLYIYLFLQFLGLLVDANSLIREAARKILGLVNLPKLQVFKSAVDGLITSLEKHPEVCCSDTFAERLVDGLTRATS
jgi:hypothetical protein